MGNIPRKIHSKIQSTHHAVEKRRPTNVGGLGVPVVVDTFGEREVLPLLRALGHVFVHVDKHVAQDALLLKLGHLLAAGEDVAQEDGLLVTVVAYIFAHFS